ncbi:kin of IRRE-like protein 3 [Branchiostoma floridae]|uniref:Kin of IRRE-like protein 3 n=1 Tax=Branchiostoma floridae TaxID=7739 RepID=A0A9J7KS89_BRAFL|nr:kin of IRRE-like protein 3 [Branchiostoma floridae]
MLFAEAPADPSPDSRDSGSGFSTTDFPADSSQGREERQAGFGFGPRQRPQGDHNCRCKTGMEPHFHFDDYDVMGVITVDVGDPVRIKRGDDTTLYCQYWGIQVDQAEIEWHFRSSSSVTAPRQQIFQYRADGNIEHAYGNFDGRVTRGDRASLQIRNITDTDDGVYECEVGAVGHQSATKSIPLTVLVPPSTVEITGWDSQSPLRAGDPLRLSCTTTGGKPAPQITWLRGNTDVTPQGPSPTPSPDSTRVTLDLQIASLSKDDHQARYTCRITHETLSDPLEKTMPLSVQYAPIITITSDPVVTKEGETANLICNTDSNPGIRNYQWLKDGSTVPRGDGQRLTLANLQRNDQSVYTCQAINDVGSGSGNFTLNVAYPPRINTTAIQGEKLTRLGDRVSYKCQADGNPAPTVYWRVKDTNARFGTSNTLTFPSVRYQDEGRYECVATQQSFSSNDKIETFINVKGPPFIEQGRAAVRAQAGSTAKLECEVYGDPQPDLVWEGPDGRVQVSDGRENLQSEYKIEQQVITPEAKIKGVLTINSVEDKHYTTYTCTATNKDGDAYKEIELQKEGTKPKSGGRSQATGLQSPLSIIVAVIVVVVVIGLIILGVLVWWRNKRKVNKESAPINTAEKGVNGKAAISKPPMINDGPTDREIQRMTHAPPPYDHEPRYSAGSLSRYDRTLQGSPYSPTGIYHVGADLSDSDDSSFVYEKEKEPNRVKSAQIRHSGYTDDKFFGTDLDVDLSARSGGSRRPYYGTSDTSFV